MNTASPEGAPQGSLGQANIPTKDPSRKNTGLFWNDSGIDDDEHYR
jgi:hypothetical protein